MITAALQRQTEDIGGKVNAIIVQADAQCVALQNDMERSKQLHEVEMGALALAEARGNELIDRQNKMSSDCKALAESLEGKFAETDASTKDLEWRAAVVVADHQASIQATSMGLEEKLQVSFAEQADANVRVQQQLGEARKTLKAAAIHGGGAGTLRAPVIRKEDCNVEKLKDATDVIDFRQ